MPIAFIAAALVLAALGGWLWWAVWTIDHNPHGRPDDKDWKEGYED